MTLSEVLAPRYLFAQLSKQTNYVRIVFRDGCAGLVVEIKNEIRHCQVLKS